MCILKTFKIQIDWTNCKIYSIKTCVHWLGYFFNWALIYESYYYVPSVNVIIIYVHHFSYKVTNRQLSRRLIISAVLETMTSSTVTLLLMDPLGTFKLNSCPIKSIHDWYTFLYNPAPNYESYIYCTQEVVYPLLVFCFFKYLIIGPVVFLIFCFFMQTGTPWYLCITSSVCCRYCSFVPGLWTQN